MQARTRTLLFVLVVVLFIIVAPLLVLYAKGYSFKPAKGEVVQTGMILIDTNVPKVTVTVDSDEPRIENDPVILRSLEAGTYHVKLERDNYEPWIADLKVEVEKVTRVDNVLLTLSQPKLQQPIKSPVGQFAVSPNSRFIAYSVTSGKDTGVWMHTNGDETNRELVSATDATTLDPTKIDSITWSQNSRLLLVHSSDGRYWNISPHVSNPVATELTSIKGLSRDKIQLDQDEPTIVYYLDSKQRLLRWRTDRAGTQPEQLGTEVQAFSVATPKVFTLTKASTGGLDLQSYDVRETNPQPVDVAHVDGTSAKILSASGSQVAVLSDTTLWLLTRTNGEFGFSKIAQNVERALWSPDGSLLMYQSGLTLSVHELEPLADQPSDYSFVSLAQTPTDLTWHPAGHYIVISYEQNGAIKVDLAHVSRTAPQIKTVTTITSTDLPQFARGGLDLVYKTIKPAPGLVLLTIAEGLD